jgi:CRISPR/Cas system-associated exonuclease Cas4 (RecB family)
MDFQKALDKIIEEFFDREIEERKIGVYYPSDLSYPCLRRNYFEYKIPKKYEIAKLKIFQSGDLVHAWFRDVLFKNYVSSDILREFDFEGKLSFSCADFEIRGRFDDFIILKWDGEPILIEVKTVRDLRFFKSEMKKHHMMQLNFYMRVMGIEKGFLVYIDRATLQHKVFEHKLDEKLFQEIVKRAEKLHKCLIENKLPPAEGKIEKEKGWICSYCLWRLECLKEENGE